MKGKICKFAVISIFTFLFAMLLYKAIQAAPPAQIVLPKIQIGEDMIKGPKAVALPLQILMLVTTLSLAPYILVMTTAFIRITIVLSFLRSALGTQQVPPTQVLMGLALFLTFYVMMPTGRQINETALQPYFKGEMSQQKALDTSISHLRKFMLRQTGKSDLELFVMLAKLDKKPKNINEVPTYVVIPSFVISEIKRAFEIGFLIYLPFLVIDMVVSSVLMSMGMFMLSPMQISLPFKLLLFVMIDGWQLIVESLIKSFS